jgi:hypothetical protein
MHIACECPKCGKRLKAADSAAGKKAKCPDCGGAVPIPARKKAPQPAADDDEFDLQKLNVDAGMEGPIEEDLAACPMCGEMIKAAAVKCRYCGEDLSAPKGRRNGKRRRSGGGGMPVTVIVAIVIEVLFVLINIGNAVIILIQKQNLGGLAGTGLRLAIEGAVISGLVQRKGSTRSQAIALCAVGMVFMLICGGVVLFATQMLPGMGQQMDNDTKLGMIVIFVVQFFLYGTQIAMLLSGSAQDYLDQ